MTEMLECSKFGEGAFGAQIGDRQALLQSQAGRHDFAKQPRHLFLAEGPLIARLHGVQNFGLTLRTAIGAVLTGALLDTSDLLRASRTLIDQLLDLFIQLVDLSPYLFEIAHKAPLKTVFSSV